MDKPTNFQSDQPTIKNQNALSVAVVPDIGRWAEAFLTTKQAEGVSHRTVTAYGACLQKFLSWAANRSISTLEELTASQIREFLLFLIEQGHNSGGQHLHFRVLKTYLLWYESELEPEGWKNPIRKVKPPKLVEEPIDPVPLSDIEAMIAACKGNRQGIRDKAILLTLLDTGLRANELVSLDLTDLDAYTGEIRVRALVGKGRKARAVFLAERSRRSVRAYLRQRGQTPGPLFERESGGRLTYWGLRQLVRRCAERAGLENPPLHSFRRAFAIGMLRNGADLLSIQRLLGHASLVLIARYAKQDADDLRVVHTVSSPVERLLR
jgi:site-specific recombinase XerD